jgi:hypothetical protein
MFSKKDKKTKTSTLKDSKKKKVFQKPVDLRNPEVLDVNLVKDEIVVFFDWRKNLIIAFIVLILSLLFIFELSKGLDLWENLENEKAHSLEVQTNTLKKEIVLINNKASQALLFKNKSIAFSELLSNHIYWTNFYNWLEKNTLNVVKFQGFSGNLSGEYILTANAENYAEAAWQAKVMQDSPFVESVEIYNVHRVEETFEDGLDEEGNVKLSSISYVSFDINLKIKASIFKNN